LSSELGGVQSYEEMLMPRQYIGRRQLRKIGEEMVDCSESCACIANRPEEGILPRCLILEEGPGRNGAAVVGLNPGASDRAERAFYLEHGATYDSTLKYWSKHVRMNEQYNTRLRGFLEQVGRGGTILWTELVKCENESGHKGALPIQTYRTCAKLYLNRELELIPYQWPVFAVGTEVFNAVRYLQLNPNFAKPPLRSLS